MDTVVPIVWVGSHGWLEGEGPAPRAFAGGLGSGQADTPSTYRSLSMSPTPGPRRPLLLGWQRPPRAWKKIPVSLVRRAWFVNKHWGGRRRPRSRWFRSCPPARAVPPSRCQPMRRARGAAQCPRPKGHHPALSRGLWDARSVYFMLVGSFINSTKIYSVICSYQAGPRLHNLKGRWRSKQVHAVQRGEGQGGVHRYNSLGDQRTLTYHLKDPGRLPGGGAVGLRE